MTALHVISTSTRVVHDCWNRIGVRGDRSCPELERHTHCRNCETYSAAASALLTRDMPDYARKEWTSHYARARPTGREATVSAIVFRLGVEWLALPTLAMQEVADPRPIRTLPSQRTRATAGVVNVRGDLVTHVSLAELLEISTADPDPGGGADASTRAPRLLVVGDASRRLAFDVNEVAEVRRYAPSALRPIPSTLARSRVAYTVGLLALEDRTVGCLDAERVMHGLSSRLA